MRMPEYKTRIKQEINECILFFCQEGRQNENEMHAICLFIVNCEVRNFMKLGWQTALTLTFKNILVQFCNCVSIDSRVISNQGSCFL